MAVILAFGGPIWLENLRQAREAALYRNDSIHDPRLDPPLGTSIADLQLPRHTGSGKSLLVYLGQCQSCSTNAFDPRRVNRSGYERTILVINGVKNDLAMLPFDTRGFDFAFDKEYNLARRLNCTWVPRFFVIDAQDRITDMQKSIDDKRFFREEVAAEIEK